MLRLRFCRLVLAGLLVTSLVGLSPVAYASPTEAPVLSSVLDWLFGWWPAARDDTSVQTSEGQTLPTLDPDGPAYTPMQEGPAPSETTGGEGDALPTLDPDG